MLNSAYARGSEKRYRRILAQSASRKKLFEQAEEWILDKHPDWFSIENSCESLGLHPGFHTSRAGERQSVMIVLFRSAAQPVRGEKITRMPLEGENSRGMLMSSAWRYPS
jgi:hypothetical protein